MTCKIQMCYSDSLFPILKCGNLIFKSHAERQFKYILHILLYTKIKINTRECVSKLSHRDRMNYNITNIIGCHLGEGPK
jgi:hypothetical protein